MVEHTRSLGFRVAFALGLGTMIAAGIFSLSGTAVAAIGSSAVIAFVIAAIIASITAASYSEFASIYSENGGGYLFSSRTFEDRDFLVYTVGASLFMGYTGTTAFYLATMDEWFVEFVIPHGWPVPHGTVGVLTAVVLGALNAKGTEESGTFQVVVTGAKVAVLLAFIGGAFAYKPPAETIGTFTSSFSTDAAGIVTIAALAFITFFGFSAIAASAGEIIEPRRTVPRAIAASIVTVTVLYIFVIVAMINSPIPAEVIAQEGETAMGRVAEAFLGSIGMNLIVAGAIFSMVSASNASILAATGIGALMGRQGQAPRRFSRIHPDYGTPFWSVTTATATIVALIALFIGVFPAEGGLLGLNLGLTALTGFATLNLLAPLSLVNGALIYSRRRYPELERPVRVPLVPLVPVLGIVANLALITNLPVDGAVTGVLVVAGLSVAYLAWGGAPDVEELFERVVEPSGTARSTAGQSDAAGTDTAEEASGDRYRILVPIARPHTAPRHVRLAATVGALRDGEPIIQVVNVTNIPDQTPNEMVGDLAKRRADRLREALDGVDVDAEVTVEGHICRDVAFDIVQTARDDGADLIVMGYAEEHPDIAETVQYDAPCDVLYSNGLAEAGSFETVNVGAGGGPHHRALLPLVNALGRSGADVHVINVSPTADTGGTAEDVHDTLDDLPDTETIQVHSVQAASVAEGSSTPRQRPAACSSSGRRAPGGSGGGCSGAPRPRHRPG
ncbi:amino acid permease [Halobacteriaceae archaeon GCM10025711]